MMSHSQLQAPCHQQAPQALAPSVEQTASALVADLAAHAREAQAIIAAADIAKRRAVLRQAAENIRASTREIMQANAKDCAQAQVSAALKDRLRLSPERIAGIAATVDAVAAQPDPLSGEQARWTAANGIDIARVPVPLGVIGVIFESRPNVAADAGACALLSGNAVILRAGSEALASAAALVTCLRTALSAQELPANAVQLVATKDRAVVGALLRANGALDVLIPRGGPSLVARVMEESRVPVLAHLSGLCHTYLHVSAPTQSAVEIVVNAKLRRVSICGATETLLVDAAAAARLLPPLIAALRAGGCDLRGCSRSRLHDPSLEPASAQDWSTEYLDAILAIKIVDDFADACAHIARYGSGHTEAIVADDPEALERFLKTVDAAIVISNASTQFADGGEFGFGAEIGIATGRLHARGPVAAGQLTTYKYLLRGRGQTRP